MEKMKELYEKVAGDSVLQAKFAEIMEEAEEAKAATQKKLTDFAKEAGYEVSVEEALEYVKAFSGQQEGALSDAELDMVAGGKSDMGGMAVFTSVFTLGISCAVMSIDAESHQGGACERIFR